MNDFSLRNRPYASLPPRPAEWIPSRPGIDHDVLVVGGGQSGVAIGYALAGVGIRRTSVIDAADEGKAGIWGSIARMDVLRTPKAVLGPELGNATLSFAAWYDQSFGAGAFDKLGAIRTKDWAVYLDWFRHVTTTPVRFNTRLISLERCSDHFRATLATPAGRLTENVRKVVFATGMIGFGAANIPDIITKKLDRRYYAHTSETIDFASLKNRDVVVVGAASSAFDASAAALEAGARSVQLLSRRSRLAEASPNRSRGYIGAQENFHFLPDALRWHLVHRGLRVGANAPIASIKRALAHPEFSLRLGVGLTDIQTTDGRLKLFSTDTEIEADFVIAGTGYRYDARFEPAIKAFHDKIAQWTDRHTPPPEEKDAALATAPYLDAGYGLMAKASHNAPWLGDIHCFNMAANVSFGRPVGDVPSHHAGIPRLVTAISRDLFLADLPHHEERFHADVPRELSFDDYSGAVIGAIPDLYQIDDIE